MEEVATSSIGPHSRRDFIANIVLGTGSVLGLGGLAYRFLEYLYPVVLTPKLVEVAAGNPNDIPAGGLKLVALPEGPVLLGKVQNEVRAFSAVCTHLGCTVQWHTEEGRLICPCHQGIFDSNGSVVSGPPPRPLARLDVKVRDGQVFVQMKSVKQEVL